MISKKISRWISGEISSEDWWNIRKKALNSIKIISLFYKCKYFHISKTRCAFIPLSVKFSSPPILPHGIWGIFISSGAEIGKNVVIMHQVTIGSNTLKGSKALVAPKIGNNVFIGAGAKIIGGITIGDNVRIGANCVVATNIPANSTVVLEKARIIIHKEKKSNEFIPWSTFNTNTDHNTKIGDCLDLPSK